MIARVWSGTARTGAAGDEYFDHLTKSVLPVLSTLAGYRGVQVLRRRLATGDEFVVTTYWDGLDAIRAFAGDDVEAAVVAPDARRVLARFGDRAVHYEVAASSGERS